MTAKTFILGIGAQKAGTTWLAAYLAASPGVAAGQMKGYHIWDALYSPACGEFRVPRPSLAEAIGQRLYKAVGRSTPYDRSALRWRMQNRTETYFDYFAGLLEQPGKHITYDVTPSYSSLPAEAFRAIADGFSKRGIGIRVIFLLRDPVERCWSAMRMAQQKKTGKSTVTGADVLDYARSEQAEIRTRYDRTRKALRQSFSDDQIHSVLYEQMQEPAWVETLSSFCGVAARYDLIGNRLNARPKTSEIDADIKAQIARHYRPVYEDTARIFPQSLRLWPGFSYM